MESVRFADGGTSAPLPISQLEKCHRVRGRAPRNVYEHRRRALHRSYERRHSGQVHDGRRRAARATDLGRAAAAAVYPAE